MPAIIRIGDPVSCGDVMAEGSGDVFANDIPVSRVGVDLTAGHCYAPTPVSSGSPDVFANNIPVDRVGDPIVPHSCPDVGAHGGNMSNGSPNVFVNEYWSPVDDTGAPITHQQFNDNITSNQQNAEMPDEITQPTIQQSGECSEGYLSRAGNQEGLLSNGLPPTNKISNINIPVSCSLVVDTQMTLSEGSPTDPTPPNVIWSWTGVLPNPTPPGLSLSSSGHITGTLTTAGVYAATITAINGDTSTILDTQTFTISGIGCDATTVVTFINPLPGSVITSGVSAARSINGGLPRPHRGVDLAYVGGHLDNVLAAAGGIILFAGVKTGFGNVIVIGHMDAKNDQVAVTLYAHLASINVSLNQRVEQGTIIGVEGATGIVTGPHLHFEIRGPNYMATGNPTLNQTATVYDPKVYMNGTIQIDTGIVSQAYATSSDINSGTPTNSATTITNNNALSAQETHHPCRAFKTVPVQNVSGLDPTHGGIGHSNTTTFCPCAGPTPDQQTVIAAINSTMDTHPELDADDRKFILFVARIESNYNNFAKNPTSSALGLYQFLDALATAYGVYPCADRCDITKSTNAMIAFYQHEILPYYTGWVASGMTTINGYAIPDTPHSEQYPSLSKMVWCYGLIHHDGVGNAKNGIDKGGVEYAQSKLQEFG